MTCATADDERLPHGALLPRASAHAWARCWKAFTGRCMLHACAGCNPHNALALRLIHNGPSAQHAPSRAAFAVTHTLPMHHSSSMGTSANATLPMPLPAVPCRNARATAATLCGAPVARARTAAAQNRQHSSAAVRQNTSRRTPQTWARAARRWGSQQRQPQH